MESGYMANPAIFLIDTVLSLYILAVMLRFLLQWVHADFYNPISQLLVKITQPPLQFLRRFVPSAGKIDTSSVVLVLALQMLADFAILLLKGVMVGPIALLIISFSQLFSMLINIFVFAVFGRALISWIDSGNTNPASAILHSLTEPLLAICRKIIPDFGVLDLSPLVALVFLQLTKMMILPLLNELASLIG